MAHTNVYKHACTYNHAQRYRHASNTHTAHTPIKTHIHMHRCTPTRCSSGKCMHTHMHKHTQVIIFIPKSNSFCRFYSIFKKRTRFSMSRDCRGRRLTGSGVGVPAGPPCGPIGGSLHQDLSRAIPAPTALRCL